MKTIESFGVYILVEVSFNIGFVTKHKQENLLILRQLYCYKRVCILTMSLCPTLIAGAVQCYKYGCIQIPRRGTQGGGLI